MGVAHTVGTGALCCTRQQFKILEKFSELVKSANFVYLTKITTVTWSINEIIPVSLALYPTFYKLQIAVEVLLFANVVYDSFLMHIPTSVRPHSTPCRIGHFSTKITVYRRLDSKTLATL